ncbi:MAG: type IV pilus secretin PilQ [Bdellovibrio sp.]|nr:type IV pilus secretin PilQ [Bdellovibrio sp.]
MKKLRIYLVATMMVVIASCASQKRIQSDDDFATDGAASATNSSSGDELSLDDETKSGSKDEFADFDQSPTESAQSADNDLALENELNNVGNIPVPPPEVVAEQPAPAVEQPPVVTPEVVSSPEIVSQINSVDYKSNASGGTILIKADQPMQFTTRINSSTNQLVVEVQNSVIPTKLKRSLNTKDMASSIGSVDIYQKANSKVSRFVVQLRPGSPEPLVQPEGNSLLIVGGANPQYAVSSNSSGASAPSDSFSQEVNPDLTSEGIMSSQSLEDFMMSNNRFYGKKISIETNNLDVKDAIKFIAEESGVNMIMDEGLDGKVSVKLRQVPWDQALILLLKSKKLGYKRQGNVLRIAKIEDIQKEEAEGIRLKEAKSNTDPLIVKRFFVGYADIKDLEVKIKEFLFSTAVTTMGVAVPGADANRASSRAKVISDVRTSSIIVTDTESNMLKVEKLIAALDTQPQQVLIEGKVIEAREGFTRQVGVTWNNNPTTANTINRGLLSISPGLGSTGAILSSSLTWGQLDILGDLTAQLQLGEREDKVRILSSPRITVLSSQTANISQTSGLLVPKVETSTPTTGGNIVTKTNEVVQVGVVLKVTPQVSNEGTVTLDMDIERSFKAQFDSTVPDRRNAKTKVIVKSGQTAVIGGIFETTTIDGTSGVPGLRDIPILGYLFKGQVQQKDKNELVIFVTPRILQPIVGDKRTSTMD